MHTQKCHTRADAHSLFFAGKTHCASLPTLSSNRSLKAIYIFRASEKDATVNRRLPYVIKRCPSCARPWQALVASSEPIFMTRASWRAYCLITHCVIWYWRYLVLTYVFCFLFQIKPSSREYSGCPVVSVHFIALVFWSFLHKPCPGV